MKSKFKIIFNEDNLFIMLCFIAGILFPCENKIDIFIKFFFIFTGLAVIFDVLKND